MTGQSHYVVYEQATGRIISVCQARGEGLAAAHYLEAGEATLAFDPAVLVPSAAAHYVAGGAIAPKAAGSATIDKTTVTADGTDKVTVTGLPVPCTAYAGPLVGQDAPNTWSVEVPDGVLEVSFTIANTYLITIDAADTMEQRFQVEATA